MNAYDPHNTIPWDGRRDGDTIVFRRYTPYTPLPTAPEFD